MTITITKTKLAIGILAMALIGTTAALAVDDNPFTDVPDSEGTEARFYSEPVEWLWDNGLTTGTSATTFSPDDNVTRGQYAAFNFRYDQNIVQPALADLEAVMPTIYTAQINDDCTVRNQSGGLVVTERNGVDHICDVAFPTAIDTCTAHADASLYGNDFDWSLVSASYNASPPVLWTQITAADQLSVSQYDTGDADVDPTQADSIWFDLTVICA